MGEPKGQGGFDPGGAFESFARDVLTRAEVPGTAVAVAQAGETVYRGGFGSRDAAGEPVTPDTLFGIGSVSKSFTALAVLQLQERGRLRTADPVRRWLPAFRLPPGAASSVDPAGEITLHHLLTHTSGLPPEPALNHARVASMRADPDLARIDIPAARRAYLDGLGTISTYDELLALLPRLDFELLGPPGRYFSYSNEGYALLAAVVERASGVSFPEYLSAHILEPAGLGRTGCRTADFPLTPPVAQLYARTGSGAQDARGGAQGAGAGGAAGRRTVFPSPAWWGIGDIFGNGNMVSTARDLLRYLELFRTGGVVDGRRIVAAGTVEAMATPHVALPTGGHYGYGLRVDPDYHGATVLGHGGGNKGISAHVAVTLPAGIAAVTLCNLAGAPAQRVNLGAVNLLLGLPPQTPLDVYPEYPLDGDTLARFAGTYRGEDATEVSVTVRDGALWVAVEGQEGPLAARPFAADGITVGGPGQETALRFLATGGGAVWAVSVGLRILRRAAGAGGAAGGG